MHAKSNDPAVFAYLLQEGRLRPHDIQEKFGLIPNTQWRVCKRLIDNGQVIKEDGWFYPLGVEIVPSCSETLPSSPSLQEIVPSCMESCQDGNVFPPLVRKEEDVTGKPALENPGSPDPKQVVEELLHGVDLPESGAVRNKRPAPHTLDEYIDEPELILAVASILAQYVKSAKKSNMAWKVVEGIRTPLNAYIPHQAISEALEGLRMWFEYDRQERQPKLNYNLGKAFFETMQVYADMVKRNFMDDLHAKLNWRAKNDSLFVEHRHLLMVRNPRHRKHGEIGRNWEKDLTKIITPSPKKSTAVKQFTEADCPF